MLNHVLSKLSAFKKPFWVVGLGYLAVAVYLTHSVYSSVQLDDNASFEDDLDTSSTQIENTHKRTSIKQFKLFGTPQKKIEKYQNATWKVTGIIINPDGNNLVIIKSDKQEKMLKAGDHIDSSTSIQHIEKDKILLIHHGETKYLELYKKNNHH